MKQLLTEPINFRLIAVIVALGYLALSALFLRVLGFNREQNFEEEHRNQKEGQ